MSFTESWETLFPWRGMVVEITLNFFQACFMGNSAERRHFHLLRGEWQQGDRDPGSALSRFRTQPGCPLVISAVDTKELLVMQDSVVNADLQGQQVKPLCDPSCLRGVWGQLGLHTHAYGAAGTPAHTMRSPAGLVGL